MGIIQIFIPAVLPIFLGYFFKKIGIFEENETVSLRKFIIKVSVPFLIFKSLYKTDISSLSQIYPSVLSFFILTGLYSIFSLGIATRLNRLFRSDEQLKNTYIFTAFIGNYAFLGWGLVHAFYGEQAFTRAVFFTMFFWPVFLFWGFFLVYSRLKIIKKNQIITIMISKASVPILAALAGIMLNLLQVRIPQLLWSFISDFAALTIPMILFTIGLNFKIRIKIKDMAITMLTSVTRLVIGFLFGLITVLVVRQIFPMDQLTMKVVLLESIMPTAAMSVFFIDFIEIEKQTFSAAITFSTIFSLLTIPLWYVIIEAIIS